MCTHWCVIFIDIYVSSTEEVGIVSWEYSSKRGRKGPCLHGANMLWGDCSQLVNTCNNYRLLLCLGENKQDFMMAINEEKLL